MSDAKRGDLVQIHITILQPDQRADGLPSCTKAVPYECWIKGFLLSEEATIGEMVEIETFIGRKISGMLSSISPVYDHNFGLPQMELLTVGAEATQRLEQKGEKSKD